MLTAAITHPFYFAFGSERDRVPEALALTELGTPDSLIGACDSAYRLFYCCLPLYDRIVATDHLELRLGSPVRTVHRPNQPPSTEVCQGIVLLKHLADNKFAEFDSSADDGAVTGQKWGSDDERKAIRREFLSADLVEVIARSFPFGEIGPCYEDGQSWLREQSDDDVKASAARIAADLRHESVSLSDEEYELADGVRAVIDDLVAYCGYGASTGHDVYAFKYYMPLLVARAVQDRRNITGLRSFSLILPVIESPESYTHARNSFAELRRGIEDYQTALVRGVDEDIHNAYLRLDAAREAALKQEFDNADRREIVTVTCLMTTVGAAWQRYFLPDDHFHLSLAMQHWQWLTVDQVRAFQMLLDTVLLAIQDLATDGRQERTLLASCACQPLLDFVVMSQCARLNIPEPANGHRTIGPRWGDIKRELPLAGGTLGKSLVHVGKIVIDRRNGLSHPAQQPNSVRQTRGEMLADLCRLVDFIRFLDCSMPPEV
jgi:hypothetical protein